MCSAAASRSISTVGGIVGEGVDETGSPGMAVSTVVGVIVAVGDTTAVPFSVLVWVGEIVTWLGSLEGSIGGVATGVSVAGTEVGVSAQSGVGPVSGFLVELLGVAMGSVGVARSAVEVPGCLAGLARTWVGGKDENKIEITTIKRMRRSMRGITTLLNLGR
jgi:hypothetical protein